MKLTDLHTHTNHSYDSATPPDALILHAISKGIEVLGISDHQFTIGPHLLSYIDEISRLKEKYAGKIEIKCGLEIGTRPSPSDLSMAAVKKLDYCLFESLDSPKATDLFEFLEWVSLFDIPKGLAHTDIFALSERYGVDMPEIMKKKDIFFEINTSGNYPYYYDFITNKKKQEIVKRSGIKVSIASDCHSIAVYNKEKLSSAHSLIESLGNEIVFS